jgi:hypothetical protein
MPPLKKITRMLKLALKAEERIWIFNHLAETSFWVWIGFYWRLGFLKSIGSLS